jgi:hypothetical protein
MIKTGNVLDVKNAFAYINPAPMSQEAGLLQNEMLTVTRELAGAGDAALGIINPERASGAAIMALQDQSEIPLNENVAEKRALVEQIAEISIAVAIAYYPNGLEVKTKGENGLIKVSRISGFDDLRLNVRIDAAASNPFSKYAREQALENALVAGYISFEEYVEAFPQTLLPQKRNLKKSPKA